jgi:type I restriction-modification system DNA methylase subunit
MLQNKIDYIKRGAFDELYTPREAVECIIDYIPVHVKTIWECTAIQNSEIVNVLRDSGYTVVTSHIQNGLDFFAYEPQQYDMIITNPPYSLKVNF